MYTISYFNVLIFLYIRDMNLVMLDTAKLHSKWFVCILITLYSQSVQFGLLQETILRPMLRHTYDSDGFIRVTRTSLSDVDHDLKPSARPNTSELGLFGHTAPSYIPHWAIFEHVLSYREDCSSSCLIDLTPHSYSAFTCPFVRWSRSCMTLRIFASVSFSTHTFLFVAAVGVKCITVSWLRWRFMTSQTHLTEYN